MSNELNQTILEVEQDNQVKDLDHLVELVSKRIDVWEWLQEIHKGLMDEGFNFIRIDIKDLPTGILGMYIRYVYNYKEQA